MPKIMSQKERQIRIQNFRASYAPAQDRIIFDVVSSPEQTHRFWFTRRLAQQFLLAVDNLTNEVMAKVYTEDAAKALKEFEAQRVKGVIKKDAASHEELARLKALPPPQLIMEIEISEKENRFAVAFTLPQKQLFSMNLSQPQLMTICSLLMDRQEVAQWALLPGKSQPTQELAQPIDNLISSKKMMH